MSDRDDVSAVLGDLAVVVPIGPGDRSWRELLPELGALPPAARVVLVATAAADLPPANDPLRTRLAAELVAIVTARGRAVQQNAGAAAAERRFLWFLHADSRLDPATLPALAASLVAAPEALGYFDLRFRDDGPLAVQLNALGSFVRSRLLGLPFGDQGFFLARATLERLGGFDPTLDVGEDHALVWAAWRASIPLRAAGAPISTSARKYAEHGWLRTTSQHLWLTAAQAWRELRRWSSPK
jgi:hypothetical protein